MKRYRWIGVVLGLVCVACNSPAHARSDATPCFQSPRDAVAHIRTMLLQHRWRDLASYYDLDGSKLARADLESGGYFLPPDTTARAVSPAERESDRSWRPFDPRCRYRRLLRTKSEDVYVVEMMLETEEGGGLPPSRALSYFKMRRTAAGWRILPGPVSQAERNGAETTG